MRDKKEILIIDDNLDFAEAIQSILKSASYKVYIATSAKEAVEKLENGVPDLMIMDLIMQKGAEGIIMSRKFKKDIRLKDVPIIMLTSVTKQTGFKFISEDPRHSQFLPVEKFLEKPVSPQKLIAEVENVLEAKTKL